LPNISQLISEGIWGKPGTTNPPITVPARACMTSGYDPGQLGIYGFRNRIDYSYDGHNIANSLLVRKKRIWDFLSEAGKKVILIGVPQTSHFF